jgi:hypothetical protein
MVGADGLSVMMMLMSAGHVLRCHFRLIMRYLVRRLARLLRTKDRRGHRTPDGEQDREQYH